MFVIIYSITCCALVLSITKSIGFLFNFSLSLNRTIYVTFTFWLRFSGRLVGGWSLNYKWYIHQKYYDWTDWLIDQCSLIFILGLMICVSDEHRVMTYLFCLYKSKDKIDRKIHTHFYVQMQLSGSLFSYFVQNQ